MKKSLSFILTVVASLSLMVSAATNEVVPKSPAMSASLKPCVAMYKQGNYVGAMQDLKALLQREKNNTYAKYYLALSYTQLGYKDEAQRLYQEIADKQDGSVLAYYSQRALDCIGNPESEQCNPPKKEENPEDKPQMDDIEKFIKSGRQFHPSVTDRITKERMERQIQKEEYQKKQLDNRSSYNAMPTNEEIAAALNTLSKIGMNPYTQNNMQNAMMLNPMNMNNNYNMYGTLLNNNNPDIAKMFLYSQQNSLMNYGI